MPRKKPAAAPVAAPAPTAAQTLDALGIEAILDMIEEGKWLKQIATAIGVNRRRLHEWINEDATRRQAVATARVEAAHTFTMKAEQVLLDLEADATAATIAKARELRSHYHWMASRMNPKDYGDRQTVEILTPADKLSDEEIEKELAARLGGVPIGTVLQ